MQINELERGDAKRVEQLVANSNIATNEVREEPRA